MTRLARNRREPGRFLLKLAQLIFDETTVSTIFRPAIADLQHEIREAGTDRAQRWLVRCRGVWAFITLVAVVPAAAAQSPVSGRATSDGSWREDRPYLVLLVSFLVAALVAPMMSGWTASALVMGVLLAAGLRHWHNRHPARLADSSTWLRADINFSAIPVGGNIGGLICMIGCAVVLLVGIPGFVWFLMGTLIAGVLVATMLSVRHAARRNEALSNRPLLGRA